MPLRLHGGVKSCESIAGSACPAQIIQQDQLRAGSIKKRVKKKPNHAIGLLR